MKGRGTLALEGSRSAGHTRTDVRVSRWATASVPRAFLCCWFRCPLQRTRWGLSRCLRYHCGLGTTARSPSR